jgi:bifunctional N-acetylglucosamine-1-phosphate-uridyltransferase/glucosamine-1-phosphate-acetyltransferase GlmU-like protein
MFGYSNKAHDGYLGDSVIGEWCNLGAGTSNSNVMNTAGQCEGVG